MKIKGLIWLGNRTSKFDEMKNFYQNVMGLSITYQEPGFAVMDLPNGDRIEIFGDESQYNLFFTHPVTGFLVDDITATRAKMESHGVEFIGPIHFHESGDAWSHFRAPDGFVYELTYNPKHPSLKD
jgi:predicted enzyme related to lactoylglutathione lyase